MKWTLGIILPVVLLLAGAYLTLQMYAQERGPERNVAVIVPKGAHMSDIAALMAQEGYGPPLLFKLMALRYGAWGKLKAGEYLFLYGNSPYDALMKMKRGEVVVHSFTLPEGWTTAKALAAVALIPQLTGDINAPFNEGDLLPETYQFTYGESRLDLLLRMRRAMEREMMVMSNGPESPYGALTALQLLTLASIIEKETGKPDERPHIASVYLNRLRAGMKLQADPTVIYALTQGKADLGRPLAQADLNVNSPYNTYRYAGLPPGPICNPGKASLAAAVRPLVTGDLYFVADGSGGHHFAKTEKEHLQNVAKFRAWEAKNRPAR